MRRRVSLRWLMGHSFLALALVLVIGYSLLSSLFYTRGMDSIIASNMAEAVESYAELPEARRQDLTRFSGYVIAADWSAMPEYIRQIFSEPDRPGVLHKYDASRWFAPPDAMYFLMRVEHRGGSFFISQRVTHETASPLTGRMAFENRRLLLMISSATLLLLVLGIGFLLKQVERPAKALGQWASSLNESSLSEPAPDFSYPELNALAELIRTSLSSVQQSLEREQRFLRHSSHELRTPISVIRSNVELLYKLLESEENEWNARQAQIVERIDRAGRTMTHLTQTLLWLSRESEADPPAKPLQINELVHELVEEARYLLQDKDVELEVLTQPGQVTAPAMPARIVLGNLIRNAFQHTWRGQVRITQEGGTVTIVNDMLDVGESPQMTDSTEDMGFGLGLQLIEQLCEKLDWSYASSAENGRHSARVSIG